MVRIFWERVLQVFLEWNFGVGFLGRVGFGESGELSLRFGGFANLESPVNYR